MNLNSRGSELRTAAYGELDGHDTQSVNQIFAAESDSGLLMEVHSGSGQFDRMADIVARVLRGVSPEAESVHVLYVSDSWVSKIDCNSEEFLSKSEAEQRLHVAHSLRLVGS